MKDLPASVGTGEGGIQFKDAAPLIAGVVDNGVCEDDPRVMVRLNEATKIILDMMIPVGGMATYNVVAENEYLALPPQLENCIEAYPLNPTTTVRGDNDITQGWYEIVNNSVYLDPFQHHDNPLVDIGLKPDANDPTVLRRVYRFPGLEPPNATVVVTGKKRYVPITDKDDYLIVQNIEALKLVILSIERNENSAPDEAPKYRTQAMELLQSEVKQHLLDPRNYMRRKANYQDDTFNFPEGSMGWTRANVALDVEDALKVGKQDLLFSINQIERRIMQAGIWRDMVVTIQAEVVGGIVYFPVTVAAVLAVDLNGRPIPIRSQFFQHLENGPGMFPCSDMLIDLGNETLKGTQSVRRKYKLIANCSTSQSLNAVCLLRWVNKKPDDMMTIRNYEAIRLMMTAKFLEEREQWQEAAANQQQSFAILEKELKHYLSGVLHTVHVQTAGFGLGDVGGYWNQ